MMWRLESFSGEHPARSASDVGRQALKEERRRERMRRGFWLVGALFCIAAAPAFVEEPAPGGPVVMRRLTESQYRNSIQDIFGDVALGGRFEPDQRIASLIAVGAGNATVTPGSLEEYDRMAMGIAGQVVDPQRRDQLIPCKPASATAPDDACARTFLAKVGHLLFRRPLTEPELANSIKVASTGAADVKDFYFGLQLALGRMLVAPQFLFIKEQSESDPARAGGLRLTPHAMATRLSLLFWGSTPDLPLLKAAESRELNTPRGLTTQVDRLLASPRLEAGVRAFFADMLGFDGFEGLTKDGQLYPNYSAEVGKQAQEQTLRTIVEHLVVQKADYRDLFTSNKTFMTPLLASVYGVPYPSPWGRPWEWTAYEFPKDIPQAGILTHISFTALHSHGGSTSATLRGIGIREVLLCQPVPPPPPDVDFSKFEASAKGPMTIRERMRAHAENAACASCHRMLDPPGLALENYDTIGRFRRTDNGAPIDPSGVLDGVNYTDASGLGRALHDNPRTPACVAQRAYTYANGRPATPNETQWMGQQLGQGFAADGYQVPALLRRIALNPGFYRVTADAATAAKPANAVKQ
jgi:hypothetical protein